LLLLGAAAFGIITYRIQTDKGELIIVSDDADVDVIVKRGGQDVAIVDLKTSRGVELNSGTYDLQLAGDPKGLVLSTRSFTLNRGDKPVVTVHRLPAATATAGTNKRAQELLSGEEVGEIAQFTSPHDLVSAPVFLPDGRHVLYATGGDVRDNKWSKGTDPALWLANIDNEKDLRKLRGHAPGGISVAVSRDGRLALSAGDDGALRLWDLESGHARRVCRYEVMLSVVSFSPGEKQALFVTGDTIRICDLKSGEELMTFKGHDSRVWGAQFCFGGRRVVSCSPNDGTIRLWDVATGHEIRRMHHRRGVNSIALFPDGRRVLSGSWDRTIGVWDLETGRQLRRISGVGQREGTNVAVSPDGRYALFGLIDRSMRLWDLEANEEIERFEGHTNLVSAVTFSPNGRLAASVAFDRTVRVWALPKSRPLGQSPPATEVAELIGHGDAVNLAVFSPDGKRILTASNDGTMRYWIRETGEELRRFDDCGGIVHSVAISPDGNRALTGGGSKVMRLWDLKTGALIRSFEGHGDWIFSVAFSPDGRLAASSSGGTLKGDGADSTVRIWDVESGQELRQLLGHHGVIWSVAFSPDGTRLLSGGNDKTVILWDVQSGAELKRLPGHTDQVTCVAFLPDGRHAISSATHKDQSIRTWNLDTGAQERILEGHSGEVTWVAVSPDGRRLLSGSISDHTLRLWDLTTGKTIHRFRWGNVGALRGNFSPDGRYAAWAGVDGVVRIYQLPPAA
jgi:WD40 repeat protein